MTPSGGSVSPLLSSLLVIVAAAFVAPLIADMLPGVRFPVAVVELALGIIVGPQMLALAATDPVIVALSQFGLSFLFFLAGCELDVERIGGRPLTLAILGWIISLILAGIAAEALQVVGVTSGAVYVALALATTALGTLLPMVRDAGELNTDFGTQVLAVGAVGEFGPIAASAFVFSDRSRLVTALLLNLFIVAAVATVLLARRWRPRRVTRLIEQTMRSSGQVAVRLSVLLLVALVFLSSLFGLDALLGAFAAGLVVGRAVARLEPTHPLVEGLHLKYEGIGFGLLIPIFFIVSGMQFDLRGLLEVGPALLLVPLFAACFLLIRGLPSALVSGHALAASARVPLALFAATELPLVIAITAQGVADGQLPKRIATALVGAAMLSVLVFPLVGLSLRRGAQSQRLATAGAPIEPTAAS
jgi:Kef-type K+ transport system membrane component KefB